MQIKCPSCGAVASLDLLLASDGAREAVIALSQIGGDDLAKLVISYCGLFRPKKTQLTFDRLAKLINELAQDIRAERIMRDGQTYEAPRDAWIYAINEMLANRERLKLPQKSHGYLYEIIAGYKPVAPVVGDLPNAPIENPQKPQKSGKVATLAEGLQGLKR